MSYTRLALRVVAAFSTAAHQFNSTLFQGFFLEHLQQNLFVASQKLMKRAKNSKALSPLMTHEYSSHEWHPKWLSSIFRYFLGQYKIKVTVDNWKDPETRVITVSFRNINGTCRSLAQYRKDKFFDHLIALAIESCVQEFDQTIASKIRDYWEHNIVNNTQEFVGMYYQVDGDQFRFILTEDAIIIDKISESQFVETIQINWIDVAKKIRYKK